MGLKSVKGREQVPHRQVVYIYIASPTCQWREMVPVSHCGTLSIDESVERTCDPANDRTMYEAQSRSCHGLMLGRLVNNSCLNVKLLDVL